MGGLDFTKTHSCQIEKINYNNFYNVMRGGHFDKTQRNAYYYPRDLSRLNSAMVDGSLPGSWAYAKYFSG